MVSRLFLFLSCLLVGALPGWWLGGDRGAALGLLAGSCAWFAQDLLRAARLLHWLRRGGGDDAPVRHGVWGEIGDRFRRLARRFDVGLEEADRRLQDFLAAIQASPNGVVLLDADGRIEWANATAAGHLGIDPQRDLLQLIGNLLRDPAFAAYAGAGDYGRDVVITGRDSTPARPVRISVQLHRYGQGRRLLLSRDVTQLEQAESMRRDFVANVSHEIRTPLTVLAGFIETLQTLPLEAADRSRYLALMAQQGQRMQALVDDLLTLSRLEGSPLPSSVEWTPAADLLTLCGQEARGLGEALGKTHTLELSAPPAGLALAGAASELRSALANLLGNAVRYTPSGGSIGVQWQLLPAGGLELSVHDTGPGIAPEHLPRLTERFYRVDRSRSRETGGTGLGLAIVKHVMQRHGGSLRIASTPGQGSRFTLVLPASRVQLRTPSAPVSDAPSATAAA